MKTMSLILLCCLSLVACAQQSADDAGDDVVNPNPNPNPDPEPEPDPTPECASDDDCTDYVDCNQGVCTDGACSYASTCEVGDVCNVETDVCEQPSHPTTHAVACFETGGTLYLTISGLLTDSVYGGALTNPKFISVASDQIAGSWNVNASSTAPKVVLSDAERTSGYVTSASINLPSNQAQRFTLMVWSDDSGGYARRFDLGDWTVSGDSCYRIADGSAAGTTDGYVIGRPPLCPSACDDGNASTADACTPTGCTHTGAAPSLGTVSCAESGSQTYATVSGGILDHLNTPVVPDATWSVCYGYGGTSCVPWSSDSSSYVLSMPNSVTEFSFVLRNASGTVVSWFQPNEFTATGTCGLNAAGTAFTHVAASPIVGTIRCEMTTETGSLKRKVSVIPLTGHDLREGLSESPSFLPSPSALQYGGSDGWALPYPSGSAKPQLSWVGGTVTYDLYFDPAVDDFNLFLVDNDDPSDSAAGGDYFNLDVWNVTNVGSAGCTRVGGGISTN